MGRPRTQEQKEAISRGKIEKALENGLIDWARPPHDTKRCSQCGEVKPVTRDKASGFYWQKRKLASGVVQRYPQGECKDCLRARRREWWAGLSEEEQREAQRRWNQARKKPSVKARRNRERRKARHDRRAEQGLKTWRTKKYRGERGRPGFVDVSPLREWLKDRPRLSGTHFPSERRAAYRAMNESQEISFETAESILRAYGREEMMAVLWPNGGMTKTTSGAVRGRVRAVG